MAGKFECYKDKAGEHGADRQVADKLGVTHLLQNVPPHGSRQTRCDTAGQAVKEATAKGEPDHCQQR